ncbi:MAG: ADP-ribosylglycohydrolase family protein [Proteobacteria bacterium]|nr:ADP-ribosylglycohydrolase family protein [Pseudomonadota bacterium]
MIGALLGDIVGSIYEHNPIKTTQFDFFGAGCRYTDESVLTVAVANAINSSEGYQYNIRKYAKNYPDVPSGYGTNFKFWLYTGGSEPYNSLGAGPAARVSPIGWAFDNLQLTLNEAEKSVVATHSHPEAIKAAKAVVHAIYLGRTGHSPAEVRTLIGSTYDYNLNIDLSEMRPKVEFDSSAPALMPLALTCAFDARTTEDAIRNAVSLGGDADTMASIAGAVAESFFGIPDTLKQETLRRLPNAFLNVMAVFREHQSLRAS